MVSGGAPLVSVTRTRNGIISAGGTPLPFSRTASSTTRTLSGRRWMSATRPSTLRLNSGRLSVGAARLAVRQATRPRPIAAATRPIASARAKLPDGAKKAAATAPAPTAGPTQRAGSLGSSK
jgi:phosphoketolase